MQVRKTQKTIGGKKYSPSNVYPFVPFGLIIPKDATKQEIARAKITFKKNARHEAEQWAAHLRRRGFHVKIITTADAYTVYEKVK